MNEKRGFLVKGKYWQFSSNTSIGASTKTIPIDPASLIYSNVGRNDVKY